MELLSLVIIGVGTAVLVALSLVLIFWALVVLGDIISALWAARLLQPELHPYFDYAIFRTFRRIKFAWVLFKDPSTTRVLGSSGQVLWDKKWLDEKNPS